MRGDEDLHGNVPDESPAALLLIDFINDLEFQGGAQLFPHALAAAHRAASLKTACARLGIPAVYVNDNFGRWRSDFGSQVRHCLEDGVRGAPLVELLRPGEDDYFVLKPKHSGFYSTTLDLLLEHLGARTLVLAGIAGDVCILFTAHDAHMRGYRLFVPADCCASEDPEANRATLAHLARLGVDVRPSTAIDVANLARATPTWASRPSAV